MIYFTTHWEDLGRITPQGGPQNYGASAAEVTGWYVGVPFDGGGEGGGMPTRGGDLHLPLLEQSITVHHYQSHYEARCIVG